MHTVKVFRVAVAVLAVAVAPVACGEVDRHHHPAVVGASFNAALTTVVGSGRRGGAAGTVRYAITDVPVSFDPGNIGFGYGADFARLYARSLVRYPAVPGAAGLRPVPDLATGLGKPSDGGRTWTYTLRPGLSYEDGTPVTARDVKYAVARSEYTTQLSAGPRDLRQYLVDSGTYQGPYVDPDLDDFPGVTTTGDRTVVFHLRRPFAEFDDLAAGPQTAPVPAAKDTRLDYERHPLSTGPYMFASHQVGTGLTLVPNPHGQPAGTGRIVVTERVAPADLDSRLLAGTLDADLAGTGLAAGTRTQVMGAPTLSSNADNPFTGVMHYAALETKVAPFDDPRCRHAVQYAVDRTALVHAYGGPLVAAAAGTALPPTVSGYQAAGSSVDPYPADLGKARAELATCGHAGGFATSIAVRSDRPGDVAAAGTLSRSLAGIGIMARVLPLLPFQWGGTAGRPAYVRAHRIGILIDDQAADWPTGYGFLDPVADGRAIAAVNNRNLMELADPTVDRLLGQGQQTTDPGARAGIWAGADQAVMATSAFVPLTDEKVLLYRNPHLSGVTVPQAYGMYDYTLLGR